MVINIIPDDLIEMINDDNCVIIDVREKFEYDSGHIKDSVLIPMYDIFNNTNLVKKYNNKNIVLVCSSGYRSYYAGKFLEENGLGNIYNLYNGVYGWEMYDYPLEF